MVAAAERMISLESCPCGVAQHAYRSTVTSLDGSTALATFPPARPKTDAALPLRLDIPTLTLLNRVRSYVTWLLRSVTSGHMRQQLFLGDSPVAVDWEADNPGRPHYAEQRMVT
ncbi:uncharacterized protein BKCO1_1100089 [Diplodia corticola]|uniref:Uncharacterized protein n=1 Tax=Diplodia corticola TaxID=236234 RepID=A0A1J9R7G6_9PEZI|nr:uncharacterized protein BKCO1_1100089 [Diplodia corticola]OJD36528.1 hypothetical protein BKCO1_1100089 [Diplodia corticola]